MAKANWARDSHPPHGPGYTPRTRARPADTAHRPRIKLSLSFSLLSLSLSFIRVMSGAGRPGRAATCQKSRVVWAQAQSSMARISYRNGVTRYPTYSAYLPPPLHPTRSRQRHVARDAFPGQPRKDTQIGRAHV